MILINLLPHREEKRRLRKQAFFVGLGASVAAGAVLIVLGYMVQQQMMSSQTERNEFLKAEILKLEDQIKDVSSLKEEIESLRARQRSVEDLQTDRNMPVYLLNELVRQTPEGMYLTTIKQDNQTVLLSGVAQTNERVSEFLRNTAYKSEWLERPELQEIKARTEQSKNARDPKRLFEFSIRLSLKRPQDLSAPVKGASAPAGGASRPQPAASAAKS